jgi:hypothetical protein
MKAKTILSILAAAAILGACNSDESTSVDNNTTSAVKFSGGIKGTRASGTTWTNGDLVGITAAAVNSGATNYANEEYSSNASGTFTYQAGDEIYYKDANAVDFTAYYPFITTSKAGTAPANVSKTIMATDESTTGQPAIDYLWAKEPGVAKGTTVTFKFAHEMSELTLKFIQGTGSPDFTSLSYKLDGIILAGTFNPSTGVAATIGTTTGSLMMSGVSGVSTASSTLILFPSSLTSLATLSVTSGGVTYTAASFTVPTMAAGNNYEIDVTINKTGLSISGSTITNWGTGTTTTAAATV